MSETVDTIEVEAYRDGAADQSANSDDRSCDSDAVGTADGSDEMDSGWVDEIRDALDVTLPVGQPDEVNTKEVRNA